MQYIVDYLTPLYKHICFYVYAGADRMIIWRMHGCSLWLVEIDTKHDIQNNALQVRDLENNKQTKRKKLVLNTLPLFVVYL